MATTATEETTIITRAGRIYSCPKYCGLSRLRADLHEIAANYERSCIDPPNPPEDFQPNPRDEYLLSALGMAITIIGIESCREEAQVACEEFDKAVRDCPGSYIRPNTLESDRVQIAPSNRRRTSRPNQLEEKRTVTTTAMEPQGKKEYAPLRRVVSKGELLAHYCGREPKRFTQFDGFANQEPDSYMRPDADKDCLFCSTTYELMTGAPNVRILITPNTPKPDVVRLLNKLVSMIGGPCPSCGMHNCDDGGCTNCGDVDISF